MSDDGARRVLRAVGTALFPALDARSDDSATQTYFEISGDLDVVVDKVRVLHAWQPR
jgi:hypothetical protein